MSPEPFPNVLILTPVKDAAHYLDRYCELLQSIEYPRGKIAIGMLEGDSADDTYSHCLRHLDSLPAEFRRRQVWKRDFGFRLPPGVERYDDRYQLTRRSTLARARNHLLFNALQPDDDWVLWIDVDLVDYPPNILSELLSSGFDVVQPDCVRKEDLKSGGSNPGSFDLNAWRDHGKSHLHDLRSSGGPVELHSVGGTMLLVRADAHRDGLIFPPFRYGVINDRIRPPGVNTWYGEIETEGLGILAHDMGISCWGLPYLRTVHA